MFAPKSPEAEMRDPESNSGHATPTGDRVNDEDNLFGDEEQVGRKQEEEEEEAEEMVEEEEEEEEEYLRYHPSAGKNVQAGQSDQNNTFVQPNRQTGLKHYCNESDFSDVLIKFGNRGQYTFHGHRLALASESRWFKNALGNKAWIESSLPAIVLRGDATLPLFMFLCACYFNYPTVPFWPPDFYAAHKYTSKLPLFHLNVYKVADKYDALGICAAAAKYTCAWLRACLDKAAEANLSAVDLTRLKGALQLTEIVSLVYEITKVRNEKEPLREAFLDVIFQHPTTKPIGNKGTLRDEVEKAAREVNAFGTDMYIRTVTLPDGCKGVAQLMLLEKVKCPACSAQWMWPRLRERMSCPACASGAIDWWPHIVKRT